MRRHARHAIERLPRWATMAYHPQKLPAWVGPALSLTLVITSLARAADYLATPTPTGELLAFVEIIGVRAWGFAFLTVGVGIVVALASRGLPPLVVAHCAGIAVYAGYFVALLQGILAAQDLGDARWRALGVILAGLILHIIRVITLGHEVKEAARLPVRDRRRPR